MTRKITGIEDTVVAGALFTPSAASQHPSSRESIRLSGAAVIAGRYELQGLVGVGGMGSVYRARDSELDEVIALKVLRRELVDAPGMLDRFRREVKLARRVTHRNVARTFDIGEHQGERFLTMEFIEGEPLAILLEREGTLPLSRVVEIVRAMCAGLAAAHSAGVVHRDLKPDNVLIANDGRIAITDFGVARLALDAANPQHTLGIPVGTPAYMAPEQVEGAETDARTDVYALGAILFELLTGEPAWSGPSPYSVAAARLLAPAPDPRDKKPDLADEVAELVMRCMAREKERRFASVDDLAAALTALDLHGQAGGAGANASRRLSSMPSPKEVGKVVAVLPFLNRGEADDEYVGDGLTEELIDALSMADGLKVRPRGMVMKLKGSEMDPRELGRDLGVQVVVEGSFRKIGDTLRVAARLVSVAEGFQLWTRRYERLEKDLLSIVDEAADAIAESLTVMRFPRGREALSDGAAIDLYLRARHEYHKGWSANVARAVALFEEAQKRVPGDPRILSGYALAQMRRLALEESSEGAAHVALRAAERARAAAPNAGEPKVALANYHLIMGDAAGAAREVNEALRLAPSLPDVHDLCGRILIEVGRPEEGIAFLERALVLEPSIFRARMDIARVSALMGDWSKADDLYAAPEEDEAEANAYWFPRARLALWRGEGEWAEWAKVAMASLQFSLRAVAEGVCDLILTRTIPGSLGSLLDTLGKIRGRVRRRPIFFRQLRAEAFAFVGDDDTALLALDEAATLGLIDLVWLDRCPLFDALRADERFVATRDRVAERAARVLDAFT
jgi:TolB-like protein/predicted Ser/Thr protein kinase